MQTIRLTYCGMHGAGRTLKEAKQDATRKLEALAGADFTPVLIRWRDESALMYRERDGYTYCLIHGNDPTQRQALYSSGRYSTLKDAEIEARRHLADVCRLPDDCDAIPSIIDPKDREGATEYQHKTAWLERFRKATAAGLEHFDAHAWAGGCIGRPDLVGKVPA